MKFKTDKFRETEDMLGWLMCTVVETKRHAPEADTPTLFAARVVALVNGEIGKLKILSREIFSRLEPGDQVYLQKFDVSPQGRAKIVTTVTGWTPSGKAVYLKGLYGSWGWECMFIPNLCEAER